MLIRWLVGYFFEKQRRSLDGTTRAFDNLCACIIVLVMYAVWTKGWPDPAMRGLRREYEWDEQ
jgi:hypothetical protein